jgi:hypothetical protein
MENKKPRWLTRGEIKRRVFRVNLAERDDAQRTERM